MNSKKMAKSASQAQGVGEVPHFLKQIHEVEPKDAVTHGPEKPAVTCSIEHVYGFTGERKSCLFFGKDNNEIVYMAAAIGVVQDLTTGK